MKSTPQLLLKRTTLNIFVIILGIFFILGSGGTPVITILGDNPATVQQGGVYVDAGATLPKMMMGLVRSAYRYLSTRISYYYL